MLLFTLMRENTNCMDEQPHAPDGALFNKADPRPLIGRPLLERRRRSQSGCVEERLSCSTEKFPKREEPEGL
ncbi:hypothetical protein AOLI_G00299640 [Acnodon oligacanthus]